MQISPPNIHPMKSPHSRHPNGAPKARPNVANMPLLSSARALGSPASALSWRPAGLVTWEAKIKPEQACS